jgi:hypothetical protein
MFNLGKKQLCLTVTRTLQKWSNLHRDSELWQSQQLLLRQEDKGISVAKNAVAGVYTITPVTPYDDTKTYDIVLGIAQKEYCLISLVILMYGLSI